MFLSCPSHKKCCLHKKMPSYMFMERDLAVIRQWSYSGLWMLLSVRCHNNMRPMHTAPFDIKVRTCIFHSSFLPTLQWDFLYLSKLLGNTNVLSQMSFLWKFYPQVSCYRSTWPCPVWNGRVSSLFFLCLCSLSPPSSYSHLWSCCKSVFIFIHHWFPTLI